MMPSFAFTMKLETGSKRTRTRVISENREFSFLHEQSSEHSRISDAYGASSFGSVRFAVA